MFKRVEKRIRKKEKEEELGIDEDMKEMLGMHDTDSEESDSSSSEDEGVDVAGDFDGDSDGSGAEEDAEEDDEEDDVDAGAFIPTPLRTRRTTISTADR